MQGISENSLKNVVRSIAVFMIGLDSKNYKSFVSQLS